MKGVAENAWLTAETEQVSDYWGAYRLIIVTNLRDFLILGEDEIGRPARLEMFHLAKDVATFWRLAEMPESAQRRSVEHLENTSNVPSLNPLPCANPGRCVVPCFLRTRRAATSTRGG